MYIHRLVLHTAPLAAQLNFYTDVCGFRTTERAADAFTLKIDRTLLTFRRSGEEAYYHFAFNIPSDSIRKALAWLATRVDVLGDAGRQIIDFSNWNAEAVYFRDPAGNVVEFIARKNLGLRGEGTFGPASVAGVSEIGLPVDDVRAAFDRMHAAAGIARYWGDYDEFCAAGDEHGLFILVDRKRKKWYPTEIEARFFPVNMVFEQAEVRYGLMLGENGVIVERRGS
jgi:catechol-2,3-dioxygenase